MKWLSRIVSTAILLALVGVGAWLFRRAAPTQKVGQDFHVYALFRDGSRLATSSPVLIAGVRVGEVEKLTIEGNFARVDLRLTEAMRDTLPVDSWITKRAESAFGDSYIEIIPGGEDSGGAPDARTLKDGDQIFHVLDGSSTDTVLRAIGRAMPRIDHALDTVHDVMTSGRHWMQAVLRSRAEDMNAWLAEDHIDGPLTGADDAMARLERGTTNAQKAVSDARPGVTKGLERADKAIAGARTQIHDLKVSLVDGLTNAREGMDRVDEPIDNATQLLAAIDAGSGDDWKGSLGRLINDPELATTLDEGTDALRGGAANLDRFRSWIGMRFEMNIKSGVPRVYVTAEINARRDKFFLVELSRDPLGALPETDLSETPGQAPFTRTVTIADKTRFTGEFGKRFGPLQLRAGIKDSTPGAGMDLVYLHNRLRLSTDVFGSIASTPRLKITGAYAIFRSFYVLAGVDDALTTPGVLSIRPDQSPVPNEFKDKVSYGRDYFFGAALHFDDADLATLLRVYGALFLAGA